MEWLGFGLTESPADSFIASMAEVKVPNRYLLNRT